MRKFEEIYNINILGVKSQGVNICSINANKYGDGKKLFVVCVTFREVTPCC